MDRKGMQISAIPFLLAGIGVLAFALSSDQKASASTGPSSGSAMENSSMKADEKPMGKAPPSTSFPEALTVSFDNVPAKQTVVSFTSDTVAEKVIGQTANVNVPSRSGKDGKFVESEEVNPLSGWLKMDGKTLEGSAEVTIQVNSLRTGIDVRDEHMRSEGWLHAEKFPTITYKVTKFTHISGDKYAAEGTWSMHGVEKPLKTEATIRFIESSVANQAKINWQASEQSWVRVSASFPLNAEDFGINIGKANGKLKPVWDVSVDLFGMVK